MKSHNCGISRRHPARSVTGLAVLLAVLASTCSSLARPVPQTGCEKRANLDPKVDAAVEQFRSSVPAIVKKGKVPGAAIALVDEQGIIWAEGFGHTDRKRRNRVTPDTSFLINGMSKTLTATAVLLAVQDGLLDLDEPITTYLPDFKVYSRYEEHPEDKITLRRLLSCTAGLAVEAPLGNSFEPSPTASFEDHVRSIFGGWLVCPVGSSYYYGNVSSDLAAYAIQVVSGKPFEEYVKHRLFAPLGMSNSTADREQILATTNRANGTMMAMSKVPAVYPALAAGCMYSSAKDLARFIQLHINNGSLDGKRILSESLIDAMYTPKAIIAQPDVYYGLGIIIDKRSPERTELIFHYDGSGFGFLSFMHWYPEYGLGSVVLTNRLPHPVLGELALTLTDKLVKGKIVEKRYPEPTPDPNECVGTWQGWSDHSPTAYKPQWRKYCGTHRLRFTEYKLEWWAHLAVLILGRDKYTPRIRVHRKDGYLCLTESRFFEEVGMPRHVDERLQELKPGLFCTRSGISLDFAREVPTWRNYRLTRR